MLFQTDRNSLRVFEKYTLIGVEVVGGVTFGLLSCYVAYLMLKSVNNYQVEILLTLVLVIGGLYFCSGLHLSEPCHGSGQSSDWQSWAPASYVSNDA